MANIYNNHVQNNHYKGKSITPIGQIICTTLGKAKILDISGPTFGPLYANTDNNDVILLTLLIIQTQQIVQTKVSKFYFGSAANSSISFY